jgi:signal transduction histidine kinase
LTANLKLRLLLIGATSFPLAVFAACNFLFSLGALAAVSASLAAALAASFAAAAFISGGLAGPMERLAAAIRRFIAENYTLASALPREGWPEAGKLISAANRLMLELGAFRAFQINQVLEERGKAQALIETIPDGALLLDENGGIIYSNRIALKLLGISKLSPEVSIPRSVENPVFSEPLSQILASGENYLKACVELPRAEGAPGPARTCLIISSQFQLATMKKPGRVIVLRDITQEVEIENTKETFFQMITHDMRAPLSSILGYTQSLSKILPSGPVGEKHIETIIRAARRLNGMITDILNTTKMERGSMALETENIEAGALLTGVREFYAPEAARKDVSFTVRPAASKTEFNGDPALLERVVTNLVGNALKFTPAGGSVTLSCAASPGEVRFLVEDTGPGIPEDKIKIVFEKYAQMEEHSNMGFGLGLAMCRMALDLHKGKIWVESEVGKGSRFIFTIPAAAEGTGG